MTNVTHLIPGFKTLMFQLLPELGIIGETNNLLLKKSYRLHFRRQKT